MKIRQYIILVTGLATIAINPALASTDTWLDNGDGTATDIATGLKWQQEDDNSPRSHADAITYCQGLILSGNSNWRLPNIKELISIVDYRADNPAIDNSAFPNTDPTRYWSATSVASNANGAWPVNFDRGGSTSLAKTNLELVRCVE